MTIFRGVYKLGYVHDCLRVRGGGIVIAKNVVVIIGAINNDFGVVSHGRCIYLVIKIIITVSVAVTLSIVVHVSVDAAVCLGTVADIYVGVVVANTVVISDAVSLVGADGFVNPVSDDDVGAGITGTMLGGSFQAMDMIYIISISSGNYFGENSFQGVGILAYLVGKTFIVMIIFFADLCKRIFKSTIATYSVCRGCCRNRRQLKHCFV